MDMSVHAARHFQWALMLSFRSGVGEAIVDYSSLEIDRTFPMK
jgi:hypothetical protein